MGKLKGRNVSVSIDDEIVGLSRSCDISVSVDVAEFTSALSGRGKRNRAGRYSWNVNFETLIDGGSAQTSLLAVLKNGTPVKITMDAELRHEGYNCVLQGYAIANSWTLNGPLQGVATFKASFVGDGELDIKTAPNSGITPRPPVWGDS